MIKVVKYLAASMALITTLLAVSCGPATLKTTLGEQVMLRPEQTTVIGATGLKIKFLKITEDSRCPAGATCIQAGQVTAQVQITSDNETKQLALTAPGSSPGSSTFGVYSLTFNVEPYPRVNQQIKPAEYRLLLTVSN